MKKRRAKMGKRWLAVMMAALMALSLAGCFGGPQEKVTDTAGEAAGDAAAEGNGDIVIGMVVNNASADTYQTTYYAAANQYAEENGFTLRLLDPAGDMTKQQNQVQDLIGMGCDAIVVWPVNSEAAVASVKAVNEAGIPVMTANTNVVAEGEKFIKCYVGPSNVEEGRQSAEVMASELGEGAKIVYIDGQIGYSTSAERKQGLDEGIAGRSIELIESQPGEAIREKAQQIMENYLVKYPVGAIDAVFCYDDTTAVGAINAIEAVGRTDDVKVYAAACGDYNTVEIIKEGKLSGVAMQSPITDSRTALSFALRLAKGEEIPDFYNYIETPVATPSNVESLGIEPW